MIKIPLYKTVSCLYCGTNKTEWKCNLEAGKVKITVPLCNVCSLLPEVVLIDRLIGDKK